MGGQTSKSNVSELSAQLPIHTRSFFDSKWEAIIQKNPENDTKHALESFVAEVPLRLKSALITILTQDLEGSELICLKAKLLKLLVELESRPSSLFISLSESSKLSLSNLVSEFSSLYLHTWGSKLNISKRCPGVLHDNLILAHWRKEEYNGELDETKKEEWLSATSKAETISKPELENWFYDNLPFQSIFIYCLQWSLLGFEGINCPDKTAPRIVGAEFDASTCWLLYRNVPNDCRHDWRLLYSSKKHGSSWNGFQRAITKAGSTAFIVKEKNSEETAHSFGAFSYNDWIIHPKFYGDGQSFLFSSYPELRAYMPTLYNQNFQYFNHGAQTLPNGIGLGGQLEYFGLWIDCNFTEGSSKAEPRCSTYNSPQLTSKQDFLIEDVEVWCLRSKEEEESENKKSILDSNPEAVALLEMASRPIYSQGLRDPTLDEE